MIPHTQSRVGERGTCFITALASVLNLKESQVPDFPEANCDPGVDKFLAPRGLKYEEYPITDPAPSGYHFILGTSPRGGQHCVVGLNGQYKWDPHPQDGTGRFLIEPKSWGVLEPVGAQDAALLSGKRLNAAAELLRTKHDEIKNDPVRTGEASAITVYNATHHTVVALVKEAEALLDRADLDDDPRYWWSKLALAKANLMESERYATQHNYGVAVRYQESALTLAHLLIDKMRNSGRTRGRDMAKFDVISKGGSIGSKGPSIMGSHETVEEAREHAKRLTKQLTPGERKYYGMGYQVRPAKDSTPNARRVRLHRALDRVLDAARVDDRRGLPYDHPRIIAIEKKIRALEDKGVPYDDPRVQKFEAEDSSFGYIARTVQCPYCKLGYTFTTSERKKAWQARGANEPLHPECRKAAFVASRPSKAQDSSSCLTCGKPAKSGEHFCSAACEEQWIAKKFPRDYADMKKRDGRLTDSSPNTRRAGLHRALDRVLDAASCAV